MQSLVTKIIEAFSLIPCCFATVVLRLSFPSLFYIYLVTLFLKVHENATVIPLFLLPAQNNVTLLNYLLFKKYTCIPF